MFLWTSARIDEKLVCRLHPASQSRINAISDPARRRQSLAAELLLCYAVKKLAPEIPFPPERKTGERGKPYLTAMPGFRFSLSHSFDIAVCSAGTNSGVDIERIGRVSEGIIRRFFTPGETEYLNGLTGENREKAAARLWTARESYVKYKNINLLSLRGKSFLRQPEGLVFYYYELFGYMICVCCENGSMDKLEYIPPDNLGV